LASAKTSTTLFKVSLGDLTSPPYVATQAFKYKLTFNSSLYVEDSKELVDAFYIPGEIFSASMTLESKKIAAITSCTISFKITNTILQNGLVKLTFPTMFTFQSGGPLVKIKKYNQPEEIAVFEISSKVLLIKTSFASAGLQPDPTQSIVVTVTGVVNPSYLTTTDSIIIETLFKDNLIDQVINLIKF
jgi:hypothetical protein